MKAMSKLIAVNLIILMFCGTLPFNTIITNNNEEIFSPILNNEDDSHPIPDINTRVSNLAVYGNTLVASEKGTYGPGDEIEISVDSINTEMNGSLEWKIESPIEEDVFNFQSEYLEILNDPNFDQSTLVDWYNSGIDVIDTSLGYLQLEENPDNDSNSPEIYYNSTQLGEQNIPNFYRVSFDYLSQGDNLLTNPSFESNDTIGWTYDTREVNITTYDNDVTNAKEGTHYAIFNGTNQFDVHQNVTIGEEIYVSLSVRAEGVSSSNYYRLELEAYNSTNDYLSQSSVDSGDLEVDSEGYAFLRIKNWKTPVNTSYVMIRFFGEGSDDRYYGKVDDFFFSEVPDALYLSYYDGGWKNVSIAAGTHTWEEFEAEVKIYSTTPFAESPVLRLIMIDDSNRNSTDGRTVSYWNIDNFKIFSMTDPSANTFIDPQGKSGTVSSSWIHDDYFENLTSTYEVLEDLDDNTTTAEISVELPKHNLYFGTWIFRLIIHPKDDLSQFMVNLTFTLTSEMIYNIENAHILRGFNNFTIDENTSEYVEYFEDEANTNSFSPGDNVTFLGYLSANSTPNELYSLDYLTLSSVEIHYYYTSSLLNVSWTEYDYIQYNDEGSTLLDGNFTNPNNNSKAFGLNFKIPERGITGIIKANLTLNIVGDNPDLSTIEEIMHSIIIPIEPFTVNYRIDVTSDNTPSAESYYLTDYIGGNLSIGFLNIKENLETTYSGRNITSELSIPMDDIDLELFLDFENNSEIVSPEINKSMIIQHHFIGQSILWYGKINPNMLTGEYNIRFQWLNAYNANFTSQEFLELTSGFKYSSITIKGSLEIDISQSNVSIVQGYSGMVTFSVSLTDLSITINDYVGGLNLFALIAGNESMGKMIVSEQLNEYQVLIIVPSSLSAGEYDIELFLSSTGQSIGSITFKVTDSPDGSGPTNEGPIPIEDPLFSILGFVFFILIGLGTVISILRFSRK